MDQLHHLEGFKKNHKDKTRKASARLQLKRHRHRETAMHHSKSVHVALRHHLGYFALFFFVFYSCKMNMSSLYNGETWWHFPGCCTLNQRDQQYVECQHGDIWFPFQSCGITAGMPADITILPSWHWACQTFHSTSHVFKKKKNHHSKLWSLCLFLIQGICCTQSANHRWHN